MNKKEKNFEYVSAVVDDEEINEANIDQLLADQEAQQKWSEYHLIGEYLRASAKVKTASQRNDQTVKVERNLKEQPIVMQVGPSEKLAANHHFFRGFAVAASVVAVAVAAWQFHSVDTDHTDQAVVAQHSTTTTYPSEQKQADAIVSVSNGTESKVASAPAGSATVTPTAAAQIQLQTENENTVRVEKLKDSGAPIEVASAVR